MEVQVGSGLPEDSGVSELGVKSISVTFTFKLNKDEIESRFGIFQI
jgi:hypothetical protein